MTFTEIIQNPESVHDCRICKDDCDCGGTSRTCDGVIFVWTMMTKGDPMQTNEQPQGNETQQPSAAEKREIVFRGKRWDGKWIVGDLVHGAEGRMHITNLVDGERLFMPVDPATVGQFTGVTLGEQKLFEGDKIAPMRFKDSSFFHGEIVFKNGCFTVQNTSFFANCDPLPSILRRATDANNLYVIIGNRFDNPELAEGGPDAR